MRLIYTIILKKIFFYDFVNIFIEILTQKKPKPKVQSETKQPWE